MKALYNWLGKRVHGRYSTLIFALFVFIEGFFIVPVSTMLAFFCLENRPKSLMYATIATLMSGLGALAGYGLGVLAWKAGGEQLLFYVISPGKFAQAAEQFKMYQTWTTFVVALTPMPYKVLTISAGFIGLPVLSFIGLSMIARGLRFFAIAITIAIWGEKVQYYLDTYFYWVVGICVALFIGMWYLIY